MSSKSSWINLRVFNRNEQEPKRLETSEKKHKSWNALGNVCFKLKQKTDLLYLICCKPEMKLKFPNPELQKFKFENMQNTYKILTISSQNG